MDLINETLFSGHKRRGKYNSQDQNRTLQDRENEASFLKRLERPITELESVTQSTVSDSRENGGAVALECETFSQYHCSEMLTSGTDSGIADTCDFNGKKSDPGCLVRGKLVWAKNAHCLWWPAQIMDERLVVKNSMINDSVHGGVLVRFFGNHDYAWVEPLVELSDFYESFEEKSCNPRKDFQEALDEALARKQCMNHHEQWDRRSQDSITPSQLHPSAVKAARKASSSNRTKDVETEQRRGKRKRKPKVHFDEEVSFSSKSLWKVRRLRIMRHLGLAAPPGSPFSVNSSVRTAA
eukprot:Gb_28235 [translate_table: standard]